MQDNREEGERGSVQDSREEGESEESPVDDHMCYENYPSILTLSFYNNGERNYGEQKKIAGLDGLK